MTNLRLLKTACILSLIFGAISPVYAQDDVPNYTDNTLTGNWSGARDYLEKSGISTDIIYKYDVMSNVSGGIKTGTRGLDNLDVIFSLDGEKLFNSNGTTAMIHLLNNNGGRPDSDLTGSSQGIDNIEVGTHTAKLYQAWIQQNFMDDKFSLLAGLYDLNSEFYVNDASALFLHSTYGIGTDIAQTGRNGPSIFPNTSLATRLKIQPSEHLYIQAVVLDAVSGDPDNGHGTHIELGQDEGGINCRRGWIYTKKQ